LMLSRTMSILDTVPKPVCVASLTCSFSSGKVFFFGQQRIWHRCTILHSPLHPSSVKSVTSSICYESVSFRMCLRSLSLKVPNGTILEPPISTVLISPMQMLALSAINVQLLHFASICTVLCIRQNGDSRACCHLQ
jgi:hypothetical protein